MITQDIVRDLFTYSPDTGILVRAKKVKGGVNAGDEVGLSVNSAGYKQVTINGKSYLLHRIIWLYVNGSLPVEIMDHINRDKTDNRICNLRLVSKRENNINQGLRKDNTTGYKGVSYSKSKRKYVSHMRDIGKRVYLGAFTTAQEASIAYSKACERREVS